MGAGHHVDPRPHMLRAGLRLCALILAACVAGALTCGCPKPRVAPDEPPCPRPRATRCHNDTPQACARSVNALGAEVGHWYSVGDLTCGSANDGGAVCVEGEDGGPAHCAPISDAGVAHD